MKKISPHILQYSIPENTDSVKRVSLAVSFPIAQLGRSSSGMLKTPCAHRISRSIYSEYQEDWNTYRISFFQLFLCFFLSVLFPFRAISFLWENILIKYEMRFPWTGFTIFDLRAIYLDRELSSLWSKCLAKISFTNNHVTCLVALILTL